MYNYLKNDIKVKSPIVANSDHSHYKSGYALLSSTSLLDVVDGHVYWQHPNTRRDEKSGKQISTIENSPMVNDPGFSSVTQLARSAIEGKPYTVSETNHPFPNEYACEGIPILGTYASLQDWDGIYYFALGNIVRGEMSTFSMGLDPVRMAGMAAYSLMFLRGDIQPAKSCVYRGYTEKDIIEGIRETSENKPFFTEGFSPLIPLMEKTRIRSFENKINDFPVIKVENEIRSETGEISWHSNGNGYVEVSAPNTESLTGFKPASTSLLTHLKVNLQNKFASVTLISLDSRPLEAAEKLLLLATGKVGVSNMKWSEDRKSLVELGTKQTTIEVIKGEITLNGLKKAKKIIIEPLDGAGNPIKSRSQSVKKGSVRIAIGNEVTVWYYLQVKH
jgi:hypothetical protein